MAKDIPAFPSEYSAIPERRGMTLRDYFAATAAAGICASKDEAGVLLQHGYDWIATEAYNIADAMLKARAA